MRISTFFFLTRRGLRNLGKHWAMTIACIASLSVCMTLNSFASLAEVNVDSMVSYLGSQNETVVYLDPDCDPGGRKALHHAGGQWGAVCVQTGRAEHLPGLYGGLFLPVGRI